MFQAQKITERGEIPKKFFSLCARNRSINGGMNEGVVRVGKCFF